MPADVEAVFFSGAGRKLVSSTSLVARTSRRGGSNNSGAGSHETTRAETHTSAGRVPLCIQVRLDPQIGCSFRNRAGDVQLLVIYTFPRWYNHADSGRVVMLRRLSDRVAIRPRGLFCGLMLEIRRG